MWYYLICHGVVGYAMVASNGKRFISACQRRRIGECYKVGRPRLVRGILLFCFEDTREPPHLCNKCVALVGFLTFYDVVLEFLRLGPRGTLHPCVLLSALLEASLRTKLLQS